MAKVTTTYNLAVSNPVLCEEWHPTKNVDLTPNDVTPGSHKKVWWLCPKQHDYEAGIAERTRKDSTGCPYCSGNKVSEDNNLLFMFPDIAAEWHPTKNIDNKPEDFTYGSKKKVWWLCPKQHDYEAVIKNRTGLGSGCSECNKEKRKK